MGADVFDGVVLAINVENGDLRVVHIHSLPLYWRELFGPRYCYPFIHFIPSLQKSDLVRMPVMSRAPRSKLT